MRRAFYFLMVLTAILLFAVPGAAQICTGSLGAPVVNETFGKGTPYSSGPGLPFGETSLEHVDGVCGGSALTYTLLTSLASTCSAGAWQTLTQDHTGDGNGYFMFINAPAAKSVFFNYRVDGGKLCPNTTYQFSSWIMNLKRSQPNGSAPNILFTIETPAGVIIKSFSSGDIAASDNPMWMEYGTSFTSPSDGSDVILKMRDNSAGSNGGVLTLDDITFSPCGPVIQTGFNVITDNTAKNRCEHDNLNYTLVAKQTGYNSPDYQWQQNKNDGSGWLNIPNEKTLSLKVNVPNATAGIYQYRIGVLNASSISAEQCRIYSDPLTINVNAPPVIKLDPVTYACIGQPIQLSSTGATTYLWSGPNGFTSTDDSPVVSYSATAAYEGVYTLMGTSNNCPTFISTTVKIVSTPTVEPLSDASVCEGDAVQLNAVGTNITHYKWTPSDGLDHDDIANPVATPLVTTKYTVNVSNDGCSYLERSASATITVYQKPVANAGASVKIYDGESTRLTGTASGDNIIIRWTPADYLDDPSSLTPVASPHDDITYTLHVTSTVGCGESTSSVFVRVYKRLTVVNSFSPNNDGINDYWDIKNFSFYPKATLNIFNRYGQKVFESMGYGKPWDGTSGGQKVPAGTYYYIIDLKEDDMPKQSGWVVIIR